MQVAGNHAVALWGRTEEGFATDPLMVELNLIFAMTRFVIKVEDYPRWGDVVEGETWFESQGKIAARRDWLMRDAETDRLLVRASSMWVMVNTKTRRLAKMPQEMIDKFRRFTPSDPRLSCPGHSLTEKLPDIDESREVIPGPVQVVRRSDIDMNGHVNNVIYLAWALETVPADVYQRYRLTEVEVEYKAECNYGDVVESVAQRVPEAAPANGTNGSGSDQGRVTLIHLLKTCSDSTNGSAEKTRKEFARIKTIWVEQPGKV